ncbi:MAG: DNA polymerase family X protein [Terrestrivirus sp.]|uniref:DNA-directed DNA polymerase n=1 Tax=Terrestrivirus sp. TaxID=2487775 RepID=A0A3G4ZM43_9VIRU|nr:MAG: DNA polymerase family X protein [Terrestrivirus sp.]
MPNEHIIKEFQRLYRQIQFDMDHETNKQNKIKHSYRLESTKKVIKILEKFPEEITSSAQLKGVKDVGKGTLERIDEILQFGKLGEVMDDILDQSYLNYVNELDEVYGIGQDKALKLWKEYGVKSIKDLQKLHEEGKIQLPDNVVVGLKYYGMAKEKIPRDEMELMDIYLHEVIREIDIELFGIVCGSYRRLSPTSNDIDMLIIHPSYKRKTDKPKINYLSMYIAKLKKHKFIVDSLTSDTVPTKYMGLCQYEKNPIRRIDIRFMPYDSYYSAILYFTGSADLNRRMRRVADSLGYTLNEYGLFDENEKMIVVNSEKEIFEELGMDYISPELRK